MTSPTPRTSPAANGDSTVNQLATFIDTTTPQLIALDGTFSGAIAYADGRDEWPESEIDRMLAGGIHIYRISALGENPKLASFVDCEPGDASAARAARYVSQRNDIRGDGGVYCDRSTVPAVVGALGDEPAWLWCADWTGKPHVPALELPAHIRLCMVQYINLPLRNVDLNAVYSADWSGIRG